MNKQTYQGAYSRRRFSNSSVAGNSNVETNDNYDVKTSVLKVSWNGTQGRVTGSGSFQIDTEVPACLASAKVLTGNTVTLVATPNAGYHFERWSGMPVSGVTNKSVTIKMTQDYNIRAVFAPDMPGEHPSDNPTGGNGGEPPVSGGGNGNGGEPPVSGGGNGNGNGNGGNHTNGLYGGSFVDQKLIPFVRQWWWAILIVAYIAYKEWKGARQ